MAVNTGKIQGKHREFNLNLNMATLKLMKHNPLGFIVLLIMWCQKWRTYAALFGHIFNGIVAGVCVYLLFEKMLEVEAAICLPSHERI